MQVGELRGTRSTRKCPQLFGVEIEVENVLSYDWLLGNEWWSVKGDGSLRDNGREFVSNPLHYRDARAALRQYYQEASRLQYQPSVRTGIHIHMDMRWRTMEQVAAICALYSALEPALFDLCGPEREEGIYCVPWYRSTDDVRMLREMRDCTSPDQARALAEATCKYSALYLEPLMRFGTIEFRAAPTYHTEAEMLRWLHAVRRVVRVGSMLGTVERVVELCDTRMERMLRLVMGSATPAMLKAIEQCDSLGVATLLIRIRQSDPWRMSGETALPSTRGYRDFVQRDAYPTRRMAPPPIYQDYEPDPEDYDDEEI